MKMFYDGNDVFDLFELCQEYPGVKWQLVIPMAQELKVGETLLLSGCNIVIERVSDEQEFERSVATGAK